MITKDKEEFFSLLCTIRKDFGAEIAFDPKRLKNILSDLNPKYKNEETKFMFLINEHQDFVKVIAKQESVSEKAVFDEIESLCGFNHEWTENVARALFSILGKRYDDSEKVWVNIDSAGHAEKKSIKPTEGDEPLKSPFDFYDIDKSRAWGPERPIYSRNDSIDSVCFNSIKDSVKIGDERNFIRIREAGTNNKYVDTIDIIPGKQYEIAIWYHNNSDEEYNKSGKGIARNTRIATCFPTKITAGHKGVVRGIISSTNASPVFVWDSCYLNTDSTVWCNYIPNTAILHCNGKGIDGFVLSKKDLFSQGAMIAYYNSDDLWGVIPGGEEYSGYVTYCIRIEKPGFWFESTVKIKSQDKLTDVLNVKENDVITVVLYYKNTGTTKQTTVMIRDLIPPEVSYINNSAVFKASYMPDKNVVLNETNEKRLFSESGLNVGNFMPGDFFTIEYDAIIKDSERFMKEGYIQNDATVETENGSAFCKIRLNRAK